MIWPNIGIVFYMRLPVIIYIELTTRIIILLISWRWTHLYFVCHFEYLVLIAFPLCGSYTFVSLNAMRIVCYYVVQRLWRHDLFWESIKVSVSFPKYAEYGMRHWECLANCFQNSFEKHSGNIRFSIILIKIFSRNLA